jgi:hypothetical protein
MIFLIATAWLVSWSLAELPACQLAITGDEVENIPDKAKGAHAYGLQVCVPRGELDGRTPGMWGSARTCL